MLIATCRVPVVLQVLTLSMYNLLDLLVLPGLGDTALTCSRILPVLRAQEVDLQWGLIFQLLHKVQQILQVVEG